MTPYEIQILLHYHASPTDPDPALIPDCAHKRSTIESFLKDGLLELAPNVQDIVPGHGPAVYAATNRCHVFCKMLREVPLPVWADPRVLEATR